jgi:hypothetical protein
MARETLHLAARRNGKTVAAGRSVKARLIDALTARGYKVDHNRSSARFAAFAKPGAHLLFFIGQNGELNKGTDAIGSVPATNARKVLLEEVPK